MATWNHIGAVLGLTGGISEAILNTLGLFCDIGGHLGLAGALSVNPSVKLPAAPQPFWLEGPLEPPVGGHFT